MKHVPLRAAVAACAALSLSGCAATGFTYQRVVMGAPCTIKMYAPTEAQADQAAGAAFARLAQIEECLSDWLATSEVNGLPQRAGECKEVSADLWTVLVRSREFYDQTGGAFDPTVGPLVRLWRNARKTGVAPTPQQVAAARRSVGMQHVRLIPSPPTYYADVDGVRLDFGGIGQGYGAAEALKTLSAHGVGSALVDLSGDVAASGPPPGTEGWRVSVQPSGDTVLLCNEAITTSGDEFQHFDVKNPDGTTTRYSHIIDPRTGLPLTNSRAVSVRNPDPVAADALATARAVNLALSVR